MTAPVPLTAAEEKRVRVLVVERWSAAARRASVDPAYVAILPGDSAPVLLTWGMRGGRPADDRLRRACNRAVEEVARDLEDVGYAVDRTGNTHLVTGWAAVSRGTWEPRRVVDLDLTNEYDRRLADAHRGQIIRERQARDALYRPAPDAGRAGGLARHRAAYPSTARPRRGA